MKIPIKLELLPETLKVFDFEKLQAPYKALFSLMKANLKLSAKMADLTNYLSFVTIGS